MKILYSCLSRSWGGMEMYTVQSVHELITRGIETELLCYPGSKIEETAENEGLKTYSVKASGYFHPAEIIKISGLIKKNNYDLLHTQASKDLWVLVPALKIAGSKAPLILSKQVGSFIAKKDALHKFIYGRVNTAFAISNVIRQNLIDTTPLTENKIKIVHNGIDCSRFDPSIVSGAEVRKEFNVSENEIVIGMLARFSWGKGHEEFLAAAKSLSEKFDNLKFMIVGEPSRGEDEYANRIKNLADEYSITGKVIFTGFRKDTPQVLASMDIFAFPSHSEAFGIALAEALASGKPSVCSASDGVLDIAVDGVTSYLFEKLNSVDLAEKLELLINSPVKRKEFGAAARKRALENFDMKIITDKTIKYYEEDLRKV